MIERMFFLMKKYTTPVISELIDLEDVLLSSDPDKENTTPDNGGEGYDPENPMTTSLLAD